MLKAGKTRAENYIGNTIEYDMISYQVKVTIVKRTNIQVKVLTVNRSKKNCYHGQRVCDAMKKTYILEIKINKNRS